jgi:hypothetical protein
MECATCQAIDFSKAQRKVPDGYVGDTTNWFELKLPYLRVESILPQPDKRCHLCSLIKSLIKQRILRHSSSVFSSLMKRKFTPPSSGDTYLLLRFMKGNLSLTLIDGSSTYLNITVMSGLPGMSIIISNLWP